MWEAIHERWQTFSVEQKLSVVVLVVVGVFAVGLSLMRLRDNVRAPFLVDKNEILATKKIVGVSKAEEQEQQKRTDTDGDGLSDWDEVNVFKTSPNLRDTCGDGITDNVRVVTGKNLACAGQTGNPTGVLDVSGVNTTPTFLELPSLPTAESFLGVPMSSFAGQSASDGAGNNGLEDIERVLPRDPAAIRAALEGKVEDAKLDALTDEQLLQVYDQAVVQYKAQQNATGTR